MSKYLFYPGCSMESSAKAYMESMSSILEPLDLHLEEIAEQGTDVDACEKVARAADRAGGTRVVAEIGMVERQVHERGHGDRAAFTDGLDDTHSLRTVTKTSPPSRHTSSRASRPAGTACRARLASVAGRVGLKTISLPDVSPQPSFPSTPPTP